MPRLKPGTIISLPEKPTWGMGRVKMEQYDGYILARFDAVGWKIIGSDSNYRVVELPEKDSSLTPRSQIPTTRTTSGSKLASLLQFPELLRASPHGAHHCVYVVELRQAVLNDYRFREANPDYVEGRRCVYVGMTGLTPEERFNNHRRGVKSSKYVKNYGIRLAYDLFDGLNPMPYDIACIIEVKLAKRLRAEGYGVWQN